jgi:protein-L-isoaspartate O-methyltransferase
VICSPRKFILLLWLGCLILGQLFIVNGFAWTLDRNTLSPVAVVNNNDFQKAFNENSKQVFALDERIERIKRVYSTITEEDAYEGFTWTLDAENYYKPIGIFLVSDIDEVNEIVNILPVGKDTKVCELGSGIGNVSALFAARGANVIGYEIDQKLVWVSNNIAETLKGVIDPEKLNFERANFLSKDLSQYDIIFYYWNSLVLEFKDQLQDKLLKQLKPGALLVVFGVNKDKEYFPGLKEMTGLPGYESISAYAKVYAQPDRPNKPVSQNNKKAKLRSFRDDLDSRDTEVCLQAALALAENKQLDAKAYEIIKQSAMNKNLTLNERVRAGKFLNDSDQIKYKVQLMNDKEHFARIEQGDKKDFDSLEIAEASLARVQEQIKNISGIDQQTAADLIALSNQVEFSNNELAVLSKAIEYFEGRWQALLQENLDSEYGYAREVIDHMIDADLAGTRYFNALDYVKAYLLSQKTVSRLRQAGVLFMSGDREWFLLEAFQAILNNKSTMEKNETILENKWKESTAASRAKDVFKILENIGLGSADFMSEVKIEFLANTAQQFIYRGYDDGGCLEYASGPIYDARNISLGVENNIGLVNALHINLGVSWASKYIWAAYLAMHEFIDTGTMNKGKFDYFYDQQIKPDSQLFFGQRRVSYIGVWTKKLDDIQQIIEIFAPLSIALNDYMTEGNSETGKIWKDFRGEFGQIINAQDDQQLKTEFFEQARMARFVELISKNKRNNAFYGQIKTLINKTISQINHNLEDQHNNHGLINQASEFLQFPETAIINSI